MPSVRMILTPQVIGESNVMIRALVRRQKDVYWLSAFQQQMPGYWTLDLRRRDSNSDLLGCDATLGVDGF